ncbi:MAG TPA: cytosolic protein, partial [Syntrophomonas sp.]|nr:cytosolic protein [Syntrophomonas sp.]
MATMDKWDEQFTQEDLARLVVDMMHRTVVHHVFWFKEVEHQMGTEEAMKIFDAAYKRSYDTQMKRLGKFFGFEMVEGVPKPFLEMPREKLLSLLTD